MDNSEEFRCISLCSGYAGLELGLKRVIPALRTVCYVEVEAFACTNLVAKIEAGELDAAPIWTDIKTFNGKPFYQRVHIITAGYPCQPFSVAGKRQGTDDPRHLWPYIERIVSTVRPLWCFFENVSGHLSIGFPEVYRSLRLMGYKVEAGLFTAAEVGAPHKRERLFILAYNEKGRCSRSNISIRRPQQQRQATTNIVRASELADTTAQRIQGTITERTAQAGRQADQQGDKWPSRPGQPQYEWEEPRVVGKCSSKGLEGQTGTELQGISDRPSRTSQRKAQSRLGGSPYGNTNTLDIDRGIENEDLSILPKSNEQKKIQRQVGGQQDIQKKKILQSPVLSQSKNAAESKHRNTEKTSINEKSVDMQQMWKCQECPKASSRQQQRQNRGFVSALPCGLAHCNGNVGKKENSIRVDRLRLLGNGVVPQQAEKAFRELIKLF